MKEIESLFTKLWSNKLSLFQKLEFMPLLTQDAQYWLLQTQFLEIMIDINLQLKTLVFQTRFYLDLIYSSLFLIIKIQEVTD